jgi:septum formation protein
MDFFVYLASQSPRRRELLSQLGVSHELLLPDASEDAESLEVLLPGEAPESYVRRVTQLKLQAAQARLLRHRLPSGPVLCSDTTVALDDVIYGKPQDDADAGRMLRALSGRTHQVFTAVSVGMGARTHHICSESHVTFTDMSEQEILEYVQSGEPMGKAGSYAVQGRAAAFISHISGSYSGIMGLPLFETAQLLSKFKAEPCSKTF